MVLCHTAKDMWIHNYNIAITASHCEMLSYKMYVIMLLSIASGLPFLMLPVGNTTVAHGSDDTSQTRESF